MGAVALHAGSADGVVCPSVIAEAAFLNFKASITCSHCLTAATVISPAGELVCAVHGDKDSTYDKQGRHHANHRGQNKLPEHIREIVFRQTELFILPSTHFFNANDPDATGEEVEEVDTRSDPYGVPGRAYAGHLHHRGGVIPGNQTNL